MPSLVANEWRAERRMKLMRMPSLALVRSPTFKELQLCVRSAHCIRSRTMEIKLNQHPITKYHGVDRALTGGLSNSSFEDF